MFSKRTFSAVDATVVIASQQQGMTVSTNTPSQFSILIKNDLLRWKKVVSDAGIVAD